MSKCKDCGMEFGKESKFGYNRCPACSQKVRDAGILRRKERKNAKRRERRAADPIWKAHQIELAAATRERNHDVILQQKRESWMRNREHILPVHNQKNRERSTKHRLQVIEAYGDKCEICGCDDTDVLLIHHKKLNGASDRKGWRNIWDKIVASEFPHDAGYQLLCGNCHLKIHKL